MHKISEAAIILFVWGVIIFTCTGIISCDLNQKRAFLEEENSVVRKFAEDNNYKVNIIHLNDTWLPKGKFPPVQAVHCVMEGINTKERRFMIIGTSTAIPIPNEVWKIKIVYDFAGLAYETEENPGRARIVLLEVLK